MNAVLRRRLEMAMRVRDFLRAHPAEGRQGLALAHLEDLLQRAEALVAQQQAGVLATRSATLQREALRRGLQTKRLQYLTAVGAVVAKENNEAARGMLEEATAQKDLLVSRGMSETLLEDLAAALTEFEHTLEASRTGRREHVGAWASARNVLGPSRSKGEPQGSGEEGAGAGPAEVEPAA